MRLPRVLFVCIGNSCRSQMAEGFARAYGRDAMIASSAGLNPCEMVAPTTEKLMLEKNIDLSACAPKPIPSNGQYDLVVNMSGYPLPPGLDAPVREWRVTDPIWLNEADHRAIRDQIEKLVQDLILELRKRQTGFSRGRI